MERKGRARAGWQRRLGERMEWGRGCWGAGCRRHTGTGQSQLGQRTRSGMDRCLGCPENKDRASSLCASPLLSFQQYRLRKTLSLLFHSLHRVRCCSQGGGWTAASKKRLFDSLPGSLTLTAHCSEIHLRPRLGGLNTQCAWD